MFHDILPFFVQIYVLDLFPQLKFLSSEIRKLSKDKNERLHGCGFDENVTNMNYFGD